VGAAEVLAVGDGDGFAVRVGVGVGARVGFGDVGVAEAVDGGRALAGLRVADAAPVADAPEEPARAAVRAVSEGPGVGTLDGGAAVAVDGAGADESLNCRAAICSALGAASATGSGSASGSVVSVGAAWAAIDAVSATTAAAVSPAAPRRVPRAGEALRDRRVVVTPHASASQGVGLLSPGPSG
jgi:hypothetical protein